MATTRLTVALLVNNLRLGGAERQLVELAKGLDKERFQVLVVTLYPGEPLEEELERASGVRLLSLDRRGRYDFGAVLQLAALLRRESVDIVQPFLTPATFFGLSAAILARTPVRIVTERCGLRVNTHLGNSLYRFVEDRLSHFADAVIPNSEAGRRYVVSRGIAPAKVRVIYNGVNPQRLTFTERERDHIREEAGVPPGAHLVGVVASLTPAKDHETLLKAAALVNRQLPETRFAIVGDGPLRPRLEARARQLNLDSHVVFLGHQLKAGAHIASFDLAVLPSSDLEGCSNFLLEAMALGRPLVATDVGGNRELFRHGQAGFLVPPRDEKAMAESILTILHRPDLMERMAREGQAIYDARFTVEGMIQAYESLYLELWGRKAGRGRSGG